MSAPHRPFVPLLSSLVAALIPALVACVLFAFPASAGDRGFRTPPRDAASRLYDGSRVVQIALSIPPESRELLTVDPTSYVNGGFTLTDGGDTWGPWPVKLRLKGQLGSFRDLNGKSAFKVKFPDPAHRVAGLAKMTLNNMVQDPSFIHESLAYEVFRRMGVPAPRTGYATVTVDGEVFGLYLNVETLDDHALARWYGPDGTQHLYEGAYGVWTNPADPFDSHYEVDEGDDADRADLAALLATAEVPGDAWRGAAAAVADLPELVRTWAVERYVGHWDGYSYSLVNNYYLHSDARGVFTMLPWGTDQTFGTRLGFDEVAGGALFVRSLGDPVLLSRYADALVATRRTVASARLAERAETLFASLTDEIAADVRGGGDVAYAAAAKDDVVRFLAERPAELSAWLAQRPSAPRELVAAGESGRVTLYWQPSASAGAARATGYRVEWRRAGRRWRSIRVPGADSFTVSVEPLDDGVPHEFRVAATTSRGPFPRSAPIRVVPGAPSAVGLASAQREVADQSVVLTWGDPSFSGTDVLRFDVDVRPADAERWQSVVRRDQTPRDDAGVRTVHVPGPMAPAGSRFRVRAVNATGPGPWTEFEESLP